MDVNPGGYDPKPQPPFQQPNYPHARPGWFSRNWLWFVPLLLFLLSSPFICCFGFGYFGYRMVTAPIAGVVEYANNDARITERLGTGITQGSRFDIRQLENNNGNGSCDITIDLVGPNGTAEIAGTVKGIAGKWTPEDMTVTFDDGSTISVPE